MKKAPTPKDEANRLKKLLKYGILDTPSSADFDHITKLAARICDCRIALISLIDRDRQWFKSKFGLEVSETPRDISFCGHTIENDDIFVVADAELDERFFDNPLFLNEPHVRFYAGVPLITPEGHKVGTICVIDSEAKSLSKLQVESLQDLSRLVVNLFEDKIKNEELDYVKRQYEIVQSMTKTGGWELNLSTNKTIWSKEVFEIYGITDGESLKKSDAISFFAPHERKRLEVEIDTCATTKSSFDEEFEFYNNSGEKKWVQIIGRPVIEKDNSIKKLVGTVRDITIDKLNRLNILSEKSEMEAYVKGLNKYAIVTKTDLHGIWLLLKF